MDIPDRPSRTSWGKHKERQIESVNTTNNNNKSSLVADTKGRELDSLVMSQDHSALVNPLVLLVKDQPDEREGSDDDGTGYQGCELR